MSHLIYVCITLFCYWPYNCSMDIRTCSDIALRWFLLLLLPKVRKASITSSVFINCIWIYCSSLDTPTSMMAGCSWKNNTKLELPAWAWASRKWMSAGQQAAEQRERSIKWMYQFVTVTGAWFWTFSGVGERYISRNKLHHMYNEWKAPWIFKDHASLAILVHFRDDKTILPTV